MTRKAPNVLPSSDTLARRMEELDTIASVLPMERRDELAELLTDQDVETLRHLVNQGMGENTLRALTSDLAYLQAWSLAATGRSLSWPAPEALLLKFVAHHLWDPGKRLTDPEHGIPAEVEDKLRIQGFLRTLGPHAPDTVRRRLATWSTLTKWRGLDGFFSSPALKSAIRLAVRATPRPRKRKSAKAVTGDILSRLLGTCTTGSLRDVRDRAILMVAFGSGGRRRSEIARLRGTRAQSVVAFIDFIRLFLPAMNHVVAERCSCCRFALDKRKCPDDRQGTLASGQVGSAVEKAHMLSRRNVLFRQFHW